MAGSARRRPEGEPADRERCHECGRPIRGIAAARPGEHRFVGCGHRASGRFLESPATAGVSCVGIRVE